MANIFIVSMLLLGGLFFKSKKKNETSDSLEDIFDVDKLNDENQLQFDLLSNYNEKYEAREYIAPSLKLLNEEADGYTSNEEMEHYATIIEEKFKLNGAEAYVVDAKLGSSFDLVLVKCEDIVSRNIIKDINQEMEATIESIPNKKNLYGIKIKKQNTTEISVKEFVLKGMKSEGLIVGSDGLDSYMEFDYREDGHLLIGGTTGSGKSSLIDQLLLSIIYKFNPEQAKLVLIDTSMIRLTAYQRIPHLLLPVITNSRQASGVMNWVCNEIHTRMIKFYEYGVHTLSEYERIKRDDKPIIPRLFVVVDDVGEVLTDYPETEELLSEIARNGRIAGIHLILATQKPIVCRVGALVKANVSSRIAFRAASLKDLDIILEDTRATRIVEDESFLYSKPGEKKLLTGYAAHIDFDEIERVVDSIRM